jgi:guanylate kinase
MWYADVQAPPPSVLCPEGAISDTRDEDELVSRLIARKSETPEGLKLRIATARQELKRIEIFDYVIVNEDCRLPQTIDTIAAIVRTEHHRVAHRKVTL